jgi:hypothetical protein
MSKLVPQSFMQPDRNLSLKEFMSAVLARLKKDGSRRD